MKEINVIFIEEAYEFHTRVTDDYNSVTYSHAKHSLTKQ